VKQRIVDERLYKDKRLEWEEVAETTYRPLACKREYRMIIVRKHLLESRWPAGLSQAIAGRVHQFKSTHIQRQKIWGHSQERFLPLPVNAASTSRSM